MKSLLMVIGISLAACGGSKANSETPANGTLVGTDGDPMVDPTVPSWAPKSCEAYQKAVAQAIACDAIEQATRDQIQQAYNDASASWKSEQEATPERIAEVDSACTSAAEAATAETTGKCGPATAP